MKILFKILLIVLFLSCERDTLRDYPYEPEQSIMLYIDVYPVEDAEVDMNNLTLEVNADYFNRYGIGVEFTLKDRQYLSDDYIGEGDNEPGLGKVFLPREPRDAPNKLNLWVLEPHNIMQRVAGYAVNRHNMIVGDRYLYGTTVAHEIGHLFTLGHVKLPLNVMQIFGNPDQRADPREFVAKQVDTMKQYLETNSAPEIQSIIIDYYDK